MRNRLRSPIWPVITGIALLSALLFASACSRHKKQVPVVRSPRIGDVESGVASWYGIPYHGRRAANGEVYDMEKLTAAHRTLPFGTWVEVRNLENGKSVTVRITDRGPFIDGRIIDLSKAAANEIEMIRSGIAKVRLTIVAQPAGLAALSRYAVQIGAFEDRSRAETLRQEMEHQYRSARLVVRSANPPLWRVLVGEEPDLESAARLQERIRESGRTAFIVRIDDASAKSN